MERLLVRECYRERESTQGGETGLGSLSCVSSSCVTPALVNAVPLTHQRRENLGQPSLQMIQLCSCTLGCVWVGVGSLSSPVFVRSQKSPCFYLLSFQSLDAVASQERQGVTEQRLIVARNRSELRDPTPTPLSWAGEVAGD